MASNLGEQGKEIEAFLNSQVGDVTRSLIKIFKDRGSALKQAIKGQLRQNFKSGRSPQSAGFFNAVKQYDLQPSASLGPATFVRLGVPFISIFEEGGTIAAQGKFLISLLPDGKRLGFKRISKGYPYEAVYSKFKKQINLVKLGDGSILVLFKQLNGISVPIYKFQKQVKLPKLISFFDQADRIARATPELLQQELDR